MFGKGGMGKLMQQAQQMQDQMAKAQQDLAKMEVIGEAGAGLVKVTMLGNHNVRRIDIDDSLVGDDKEMLEDLIVAAVSEAHHKAQELMGDEMGKLTGGIKIPGMM